MAKVKDMFDDLKDFELLLDEACSNAESGWEMDFTDEMAERYELYKGDTFLSEKQEDLLRRIANE